MIFAKIFLIFANFRENLQTNIFFSTLAARRFKSTLVIMMAMLQIYYNRTYFSGRKYQCVKHQFLTDLIMAVDENGEAKQTEDCTR